MPLAFRAASESVGSSLVAPVAAEPPRGFRRRSIRRLTRVDAVAAGFGAGFAAGLSADSLFDAVAAGFGAGCPSTHPLTPAPPGFGAGFATVRPQPSSAGVGLASDVGVGFGAGVGSSTGVIRSNSSSPSQADSVPAPPRAASPRFFSVVGVSEGRAAVRPLIVHHSIALSRVPSSPVRAPEASDRACFDPR